MLDLIAKNLFLTKGKGVHEDRLTSFEYALRDAGIAGTNIVLISSIFPPQAKLISRKEGLKKIKPGQILFTIYSKNQTNKGAGKRSLVFEDKRSVGIFSNKAAESDAYVIQAVLFDEFQRCQGKYFSS